jgi:hypothetical protein
LPTTSPTCTHEEPVKSSIYSHGDGGLTLLEMR